MEQSMLPQQDKVLTLLRPKEKKILLGLSPVPRFLFSAQCMHDTFATTPSLDLRLPFLGGYAGQTKRRDREPFNIITIGLMR
jgi:hypothetical protein